MPDNEEDVDDEDDELDGCDIKLSVSANSSKSLGFGILRRVGGGNAGGNVSPATGVLV